MPEVIVIVSALSFNSPVLRSMTEGEACIEDFL